MIRFKNLNAVIKSLRYTILVSFLVILIVVSFIWKATANDLRNKHDSLVRQELIATSKLFESILSQKLKLVASSPDFIRFMSSGPLTRKNIETSFLRQISKVYSPMLTGMTIKGVKGNELFSDGEQSDTSVTLTVCYLNQSVNSKYGDCDIFWTLYFNKKNLIKEISEVNENLHPCSGKKCSIFTIFDKVNFGDFIISKTNPIKFEVSVEDSNLKTNIIFIAFIFVLFVLGVWIYARINKVINAALILPLSDTINSLQKGLLPNSKDYISELKYLAKELSNYYDSKEKAKIGQIAGEVVHDLRPYLFCLYELINVSNNYSHEEKIKIDKTVHEIDTMMATLLDRYCLDSPIQKNLSSSTHSLHDLLVNSIEFAKIMCKSHGVILEINVYSECYSAFIIAEPILFNRLFLNLIKNSIEAKSKKIEITLDCSRSQVTINDTGVGIDPDILSKIGKEQVTHGKLNGHGIGLFEINKTLLLWGGSLEIISKINEGTTVNLMFKKADPPATFIEFIDLTKVSSVIIVDDDASIHEKWGSALKNNIFIQSFYSPEEVELKINSINVENSIFLIDQQFSKISKTSGTDFIKRYRLETNSILVTSNPNDKYLITECLSLGIKILPKNNLNIIPIKFNINSEF